MNSKYWLLKAEPDSRIVKGKDVKFSVDDFEAVKTSPWEGVRNYEARNLMKEMQMGEKALFYHSNCKNPGIAGFAEVSKEAYPDYTAWDESHPYFDPKSNETSPKWFMIDLTFISRAKHFIPLSLLRFIANCSSGSDLPDSIAYVGDDGVRAIKSMDLVTRGRLSVQRVDEKAWNSIKSMAENGGWDELNLDAKPKTTAPAKRKANETPKAKAKPVRKATKKKPVSEDEDDGSVYAEVESEPSSGDDYDEDNGSDYGKSNKSKSPAKGKKRKTRGRKEEDDDDDEEYVARPSRRRKKT